MDYLPGFHSRAPQDLYEMNRAKSVRDAEDVEHMAAAGIERDQFKSNFLYLDGHCEARSFTWQGTLLKQIHGPIRQKVGKIDLPKDEDYERYYKRSFPE